MLSDSFGNPTPVAARGAARFEWFRRLLAATVFSVAACGAAVCPMAHADDKGGASAVNAGFQKLGPTSALSVVWVGHSLIEHKVDSGWGRVDLMSLVGTFAESRKLSYAMADHTLWGAPLSALWRGTPHSYSRDAGEMVAKREAFEREAGRYDALVLTEAIPLQGTLANEFSPYYLRRFYCAALKANPRARVYLYQTWVHFQGTHRGEPTLSSSAFDWRSEMQAERRLWDELADQASRPAVEAPHWLRRLGWSSVSDGGCAAEEPIYTVPVGNALLALQERLASPRPADRFLWPDGRPLQMADLFANPLIGGADGSSAPLDPSKPVDDIHASLTGIYFSALVHFATLYRQSPVALPYPPELGEPLAASLQCVAWDAVIGDARSGVAGEASC